MDTAQRGMGLDWPATQELIKRSAAEAASVGGAIACGAGTDQLDLATLPSGRAGVEASSTPTASRSRRSPAPAPR